MKKLVVLGFGLCIALAFTSCKSKESAYKKAYEKAKQQELAEAKVEEEVPAPIVVAPVQQTSTPVQTVAPVEVGTIREERVQLVSGVGLKAYSVVCGSYTVKANADGVKANLDADGYSAKIVYNAEGKLEDDRLSRMVAELEREASGLKEQLQSLDAPG